MNITLDNILNLYQSCKLEDISKINKQILIAQYAQCKQISDLNKEIKQSNAVSIQILENQLKEAKHKETLKYYKSLAYNMDEALSLILSEKDPALQIFLVDLYLKAISFNTQEAKDNLEDIPDKIFCAKIETKISLIENQTKNNRVLYINSSFHKLLYHKDDYYKKIKNISNWKLENNKKRQLLKTNIKPYNNIYRGCLTIILSALFIFALLFMLFAIIAEPKDWVIGLLSCFIFLIMPTGIPLFFIMRKEYKWRKNYTNYIGELKLTEQNLDNALKSINQQETEMLNHPYLKAQKDLSLSTPHWQEKTNSIYAYIPNNDNR